MRRLSGVCPEDYTAPDEDGSIAPAFWFKPFLFRPSLLSREG